MGNRDYKVLINIDADLEDSSKLFFVKSLTVWLKAHLDEQFKNLPFEAEYHLSFSRNT